MDNLEAVCQEYRSTGLYTHVYTSCGFLRDDQPTRVYSILPDGSDVFDLSSLTKALVTTPLVVTHGINKQHPLDAATLEDVFGAEHVLKLSPRLLKIPLAALLRHEAGLPAWRNFYVECEGRRQSLEEALKRSEAAIRYDHTSKDVYSDIGFLVLGRLLEGKLHRSLADIWRDFRQDMDLELEHELGPSQWFLPENVVPTAYCPVRQRMLKGEVHDENCWALGGFTGHSGLFGTGDGIQKFIRAMWQHPLGRMVFEANFSKATSPGDSLLGWRKGQDPSSQTFAEGRGCGHLGFTGTALWMDPVTESYALVLTNRVISGRINPEIKEFRRKAFGLLWKEISR